MNDSLATEKIKRNLKSIRFEGFYGDANLLSFPAFAILDKNGHSALFLCESLFYALK